VKKYHGAGRPQMTLWRMRIACWITNATHKHAHLKYIILIARPQQQWLHEHALMLRYTYIFRFVIIYV
jgi:hypothetical protein